MCLGEKITCYIYLDLCLLLAKLTNMNMLI